MQLLQHVYCATFIGITIAVIYMLTQYRGVIAMSEGTSAMSAIAEKIRSGAKVFTKAIYGRIIPVALILAVVLSIFVERWAGVAYLAGAILTSIAVIVGMTVATYANVRAAATALANVDEDENIATARTCNTTVKASQICGIVVQSSVLLGLVLTTAISGWESFFLPEGSLVIPIVARLTSYGLGWSTIAMFCRVPGGIFTKAADIGADLIGKVYMHFKEDDPKNPAVLSDLVGDNVNDIDGNQADLGESFNATPVTVIITAVNMYGHADNAALLALTVAYPFILALGGLISSIIGLYYASHAKSTVNPSRQLNASMFIAAAGTLATSLCASYSMFANGTIPTEFKWGWSSPFWGTVCGIIAGIGIGFVAQHYTDLESKWAKMVAGTAKNGSAICASMSQVGGWISCFGEIAIVAVFSSLAAYIAGPYGRSVMALGMLAFVAQPIGADAFGPISDNAGGIAECCELPSRVRKITDKNDAAGNTTAAVGKGFAIGSAAAVVISQITTYRMAYGAPYLDITQGNVFLGASLGAGLMATFCGLLGLYTLKAADEMAAEVKKQLTNPDVVSGLVEPDSYKCIRIATENALKKMIIPVAIPVFSIIGIGFLLGADAAGGALVGVELVGLPLAIYFSNAGGLADNAKKRFEASLEELIEGMVGYDLAHDAAVVGDTMGDWFKDVVATSIDIFMKIMGTIALMLAPMFAAYQILPLF